MKLPGVPGMALGVATHILNGNDQQPPEPPAPELTMTPGYGDVPPQVQYHSSGDVAAQKFAEAERHKRNRTAIKCGTALLAVGGTAALVLYGCDGSADRTPGGHSVATVESPNEVLNNVKFTSDTRIALLGDAEGSTEAIGVDYYCPPWPANIILGCAPTSVHKATISVTEDIELLAKAGSLKLDAEMGPDNKPVVTVHVDPQLIEANPQGAIPVIDDSTYGAQWVKNRFGTTQETKDFQASTSRYAQDRLTDDCAHTVESEGHALEVAIADAARQKILDVAPTLHTADPQGEQLLDEMGSASTTYKIDANGKPIVLQTSDMYKEGQTLKIGGMDIRFAPSKQCNLGPTASTYLVNKANDPTVQVIADSSATVPTQPH